MDAPVHVYYVLSDFFQNHKRYVRSVDYNQLHGKDVGAKSLASCVPQRYYGGSEKNSSLPHNGLMNPCGLTAWSVFNDSFSDFQVWVAFKTRFAATGGYALDCTLSCS
jgi:LEM3 (ligand-effect modulator 3) family / CDC50 family